MRRNSLLPIILVIVSLFVTEAKPIQSAAQSCALPPQISRVSVAAGGAVVNGRSHWASLSGDGRFVEFESQASNLIAGDTNNLRDVFVVDRQSGQSSRASIAPNNQEANAHSFASDISADGRYVAFESWASNLVSGDSGNVWDVFVYDRQSGQTSRVSMASSGTQGNDSSTSPQISDDGRYVAFDSSASNLVAGDNNGVSDIFVHDRQTAQTSQITAGNGVSVHPALSADGRFVAFISFANNLVAGDADGLADLFVYDRQSSSMIRIVMASQPESLDHFPVYPSLSDDGRFVTFESEAGSLVAADSNGVSDIFVYDQQSGQTTLASTATNGEAGNGSSAHPRLSADGQRLAFQSQASNLITDDSNGVSDVFVRDLLTGQLTRLSRNMDCDEANGASYAPNLSADGQYAVFTSEATNLIPGDSTLCDGERCADVFVVAIAFAPVVEDLPEVAPLRNFITGDVWLIWRGVTWATQYRIQVASDETFNGLLYADEMVDAATLELELPNLGAGTYFWRVQAQKTNTTWSAWSVIETFTVSP